MSTRRKATAQGRRQVPGPQTPVAAAELTAQLRDEVKALSLQGESPRQIARSTGLAPAQVIELVRELMEAEYHGPEARAIVGCWVNAGWSIGLTIPTDYEALDREVSADYGSDGLAIVVVARREPLGMVRVCQYLVDLFCLGVKNTIGPLVVPPEMVDELLGQFYQNYANGCHEIPAELATDLVWGAVHYAAELGFAPAAGSDWRDTCDHLDELQGASRIGFGRDGRPFYVNGPYENADNVLATLRHTVGEGNFDTMLQIGG